MNNITLQDILTTYWSQTTLVLLAIGYLVKNYTDMKAKKTEINHNLFQGKKMDSVNKFFSNSATTLQMWKDLPILKILDNKLTANEIDQIISPNLDELRRNVLELKIYFADKDNKNFENVMKNMDLINGNLSKTYFNYNSEESIIVKSNNFQFFRDEKLVQINLILNEITNHVRKDFR